jgi:RNA polymerase sigma-70 factor (ECF subfamily)
MAGPESLMPNEAREGHERSCAAQPPLGGPVSGGDVDSQLMRQVREGDRQAASVFAERNRPRIARYIARLVHDPRCAEDLTQDVFLQAFRHAGQYDPALRVSTWLYRIATNVALNYLHRSDTRRVTKLGDGPQHVADPHQLPPDARLRLDELKHSVSQAILDLPDSQRIALVLFEYEECSYAQIAAVLGVSIEAVRSLLMRARTKLRRSLTGLA